MNVLFLSQRVPYPPDRGDRITTYHFLQHLLSRGDEVRVGCLADEEQDTGSIATLRGMVADICAPRIHRGRRRITSLRSLLTGGPLTTTFFASGELRRTVDGWIRDHRPDFVYVYSSSMAQYVLRHDGLVRFMQFAELDSDKWRQYAEHSRGPARWIYRREAARLLEFEREVARRFSASAVVSAVEKDLFMQQIADVTPVVLPNGVDVEHFASAGEERREAHTVIFTGVMDYEPNVQGVTWFVREVWPEVRRRYPAATFLIVGSRPVEQLLQLHGKAGIEVTGRVDTIPPYLDRAAVAVAPLRLARGVQNKVLEAMSTALPVVASPQAVQGLGQLADDTVLVADDVAGTTAAVVGLLDDPERARRIGRRAAEHVRQHYRWENMYAILDAVIEEHLAPGVTAVHPQEVTGSGTAPAP